MQTMVRAVIRVLLYSFFSSLPFSVFRVNTVWQFFTVGFLYEKNHDFIFFVCFCVSFHLYFVQPQHRASDFRAVKMAVYFLSTVLIYLSLLPSFLALSFRLPFSVMFFIPPLILLYPSIFIFCLFLSLKYAL